MTTLLHVCCAPCLSGARKAFEDENMDAVGLWFNPNIHPWKEFDLRLQTLQRYMALEPIEVIYIEEYPLIEMISLMLQDCEKEHIAMMSPEQREKRCRVCYTERLNRTADTAIEKGFDSFSTTLLLSKYQRHELIREVGENVSDKKGIEFMYDDMRKYWSHSLDRSRELRLYRQKYCGCIFSEQERYLDH